MIGWDTNTTERELDCATGELGHVRDRHAEVVRASVAQPERFEAVFDEHHGRIWAYLARVGGRECADDLAAEVFLTAFAHRDRYDPARGSVPSWLYGIATNLMRTRFRGQARAARAFTRAAADPIATATPTEAVDDAIASRDALDRVRAAMARLSLTDREVIVLFVWERLSYEAIARVLDIEVGTVRSRLSRARRRLRELAGLSGELSDVPAESMKKVADG
ncbi:MAG: RNA polymerase sigma factor [Acidimicrobiales bacterium]